MSRPRYNSVREVSDTINNVKAKIHLSQGGSLTPSTMSRPRYSSVQGVSDTIYNVKAKIHLRWGGSLTPSTMSRPKLFWSIQTHNIHMLQVCHELSSWYICMTQGLVSHALGVPGLLSTITLVQVTHPRAFWHILQVYQVYHQLLPWSNLHIPGPFVTCSRCTRSIINYHPGTYIHILSLVPGLSSITTLVHVYMFQGLLSHSPGIPGLSSTITLVHVAYPWAFCHMLQVYQVYHQFSPWSKLHIPWPSVTCTRCTRPFHNMHIGPSYISVCFLQVV